ncbi:PilC/PilY family type IV pilus protein [Parendozoicomonas haliclonae]|uniref:Uncharacterized protein n=1 Tax=Parendozoicomonas haliclonae TaxID=1960125 RepID=A0A1X7AJ59_9GAMM|nr:PilC/PilY family type IV pilus protein [Parendozoicomonas haliclonae]SMA40330.1 hypothetical protein EHSB41UT_01177 [Parendozoicomonas haliclonae]
MQNKRSGQVFSIVLATFLGAGTFHSAIADDTEIFFGGAAGSNDLIAPNVLFVLDNSGSMSYSICNSWNCPSDLKNKNRMDVLQESFSALMDSTVGMSINAGLIRFHDNNSYQDKNGVYHPVLNINDPAGVNPVEVLGTGSVTDADEHIGSGAVTLESNSLRVGTITEQDIEALPLPLGDYNSASEYYSGYYNRDYLRFYNYSYVGLHFEELDLPPGAIITSAHMEIQATDAYSWERSGTTIEIGADKRTDRNLNRQKNSTLSDRYHNHNIDHNKRVDWPVENFRIGNTAWFKTPDIRSVVQAVVDENQDDGVDSITFMMTNWDWQGSSIDGVIPNHPDTVPKLFITYNQPSPATFLTSRTAATVTDTGQSFKTAMRFDGVPVPQGAKITKATLRLTPARSNNTEAIFMLKAEDTGNSAPLQATTKNISTRKLTSNFTQGVLPPWDTMDNVGGPMSYDMDVTASIQEVVNRNDWCGGNAATLVVQPAAGNTGSRTITSEEDSSADAPKLAIEYEVTGDEPGCFNKTIRYPITIREDDASNNIGSNWTSLTSNTLDLGRSNVGLRFSKMPVKQGAEILEAYLEVSTYYSSHDNKIELSIFGDKSPDSAPFNESQSALSGRTKTKSSVDWSISGRWQQKTTLRSPDISDILKELVEQDDYQAGNSLTLLLKPDRDFGMNRQIYAWDHTPTLAPKLVIKLAEEDYDEDATRPKVRDQLASYVNEARTGGGTPTLKKLLDAQGYMSGSNSPIIDACQTNHIVLLSDGEPNDFESYDAQAIRSKTGQNCRYYNGNINDQTDCGRVLTKWMEENDQKLSLAGDNTIITHTIGFAATDQARKFLRDIASPHDDGDSKRYYEADDTNALIEAFGSILQEILSVEATFNSASISVNQYRSYQHNNELYYALFTPEKAVNWDGNLKKYKLGTETKTVNGEKATSYFLVDQFSKKAIDSDTGSFKEGTTSFWSSSPDGNRTSLGGAASRLKPPHERKIYTDIGLSDKENLKDQPLEIDNKAITKALLGDAGMDNSQRNKVINWARGINPETGLPRQQLGDPLHSQPALVSYGCRVYNPPKDGKVKTCKEEDLALFFGTNQGFLHAIDSGTGDELFSYIPEELLGNLDRFANNESISTDGQKVYGIDGSPTVLRIDIDKDGNIEASDGDRVYLYVGMRRGGSSYVALDITNRNDPKLLWKLNINTKGMSRLGQSWSRPDLTKVLIGDGDGDDNVRHTLVFGGGYDADTNDAMSKARQNHNAGNSVFMIDALTGELLWSAGRHADATLKLDKMKYSIPGDITILDMNFDGFGDQIIFADMGGQVWRLFIDQQAGKKTKKVTVAPFGGTGKDGAAGVVADLNDGTKAGNRRFYMKPVTGLTQAGDRTLFTIGVGSGYRAHPLDEIVDDRFYVLKSEAIFNNTQATTMVESTLYDATDNKAQKGTEAEQEAAKESLALIKTDKNGQKIEVSDGGWYIRLEAPGEKALSDISLIDGYFSFVSYEPEAIASSCKAVQGVNRYYSFKASDGTAPNAERKTVVENTGIISSTRLVVVNKGELIGATEGATGLVPLECVGTECFPKDSTSTVRQTGWIDRKTQN